jgi:AraC-like DNA-binding protein
MDPLFEVFRDLRLTDSRYVKSTLAGPWGMRIVGCGRAVFHFAARGSCVVRVNGHEDVLDEGDLVLLPHGRTHEVVDQVGSPVQLVSELAREAVSELGVRVRKGGDGAETVLVSGSFLFDAHPVVTELPETILSRQSGVGRHTDHLVQLLLEEVAHAGPGSDTVVDRLADVLVIRAIRGWLEVSTDAQRGWLRALRHPGLGRAIARIHTEATHPWTLPDLAREAGMSRASFAKQFAEIVGTTPIQFLTDRRMQLATRWLRGNQGVAEVADRLGYSSAAAFSRAFKRTTGRTPGSVARESA